MTDAPLRRCAPTADSVRRQPYSGSASSGRCDSMGGTTLIFLNVVPLLVLVLLLQGHRRQAAVDRATTKSRE